MLVLKNIVKVLKKALKGVKFNLKMSVYTLTYGLPRRPDQTASWAVYGLEAGGFSPLV